MTNTILVKRSSTPGAAPATSALALGELAVNTNDGTLFLKKHVAGVDSIIQIGNGVSAPPPGAGASTIKQITSGAIAAASGTTLIPYDNTVPQSTEGTLIWTKSFTPTSTGANVLVQCAFMGMSGTNNRVLAVAIFRGTTCIGVAECRFTTANYPLPFSFLIIDAPGSISAQTYSCRVGLNTNSTWYINQEASALFSGLLASNGFIILEW